MSPFRRWTVTWDELASVDIAPAKAIFELTNGRRYSINLRQLHNAEAVRKAIAGHTRVTKLLRG